MPTDFEQEFLGPHLSGSVGSSPPVADLELEFKGPHLSGLDGTLPPFDDGDGNLV